MEYKDIINYKSPQNMLFVIANALWTALCCMQSLKALMVSDSELHYIYIGANMIYINSISMLVGLTSLTVIVVIMTYDLIESRTEEELEKSKYITPKKTIIF